MSNFEGDSLLHDSKPQVVLAAAHHLRGAVALNGNAERARVQPKGHVVLHFFACGHTEKKARNMTEVVQKGSWRAFFISLCLQSTVPVILLLWQTNTKSSLK